MKYLILIFLPLLSSCAAITPIMATVGATASSVNAYYEIKGQENITVISKECLFYREIKLSEEGKKGLLRSDKEQIAFNNLSYKENCKE